MITRDISATNVFKRNLKAYNAGFRRIINKGGTSSSKTFSVLQLLLFIARRHAHEGKHISVVSETLPHLKLGAIRDWNNILKSIGYREGWEYTQANYVYKIGKSVIEFFSADIEKATGPRRDILFLNECNNIPYPIVSELEQRTREVIFYDFNPVEVFWIEDRVLSLPDSERILIKSNYLDNDHLDKNISHEIELKAARDPNFKRIHIDIEYGVYEGLILPWIETVDALPETDKRKHGLDWGFTNDPTALIEVALNGGALWFHQLIYEIGLTNRDISGKLSSLQLARKEIIADSSEPKSIAELRHDGFNVIAADKGPDSVRQGLDLMKQYPIRVTKESVQLIKEFRSYRYKQDSKTGVFLNEPIDNFNHGIDAARYATTRLLKPRPSAPTSTLISKR